jgi:hypothetical protein
MKPFCKAADKTICFAKKPTRGGIPAKEKTVIAKLIVNVYRNNLLFDLIIE